MTIFSSPERLASGRKREQCVSTIHRNPRYGKCLGINCLTLCDPRDCSPPAPLSMEFSRQEYWSGLPFPSPGALPDPRIKPKCPTLQADSLPSEPPGKPIHIQESATTQNGVGVDVENCFTMSCCTEHGAFPQQAHLILTPKEMGPSRGQHWTRSQKTQGCSCCSITSSVISAPDLSLVQWGLCMPCLLCSIEIWRDNTIILICILTENSMQMYCSLTDLPQPRSSPVNHYYSIHISLSKGRKCL